MHSIPEVVSTTNIRHDGGLNVLMEGRASARPHIHGNNAQIVPPEGRSPYRPHVGVQTFGHTEVWPSNGKTGRYLRRRDDLRIVRM